MIEIYQAVFQAKEEDLARVRSDFIMEHGQELYDTLIQPYLEAGVPGFLFSAPQSLHVYWFMNRLGIYAAAKHRTQYLPPAIFLAYVNISHPTITCPICGIIIDEAAGYKDLEEDRLICMICYRKQNDRKVEAWVASFKDSFT